MRQLFSVIPAILLTSVAAHAAPVYLNLDNISVEVGPNTGSGSSNNTFNNGQTIDKVIDAPTAEASENHNQTTHIWYTFDSPDLGLELLFDFGISYNITMLHFWNYTSENFDVDAVSFSFFDALGDQIGSQTLNPALGSSGGILAEDIPLLSPLNTRSVSAFLTGSNGQIDFQNIGFTAEIADPDNDPDPDVRPDPSPVPLPAGGSLLLAALIGLAASRRKKPAVCS